MRTGISAGVVKLNRIAPLDTAAILRETEGTESCADSGGLL